MPFDPISWALGFGATKATQKLLNRLFAPSIRKTLGKVAEDWAEQLPSDIFTPPEAILDTESLGPERERLQIRLFLHNQVPDEGLWYGALIEAWTARKQELGESGNSFFQQCAEDAGRHLRSLARSLALACSKERELFQVSALYHLEEIVTQTELIHEDLGITRSLILNKIDNIAFRPQLINQREVCQLLENPHICHGQGLMELNALLLIDEPSSAVSGRVRENDSWVGPPGASAESAYFRPPGAKGLRKVVADFVGRWSTRPSPFETKDVAETHLAMARFHHELVSIHPFEDGNGRVARALTDYQARHLVLYQGRLRLRSDKLYVPALRAADQGNIEPFVDLLAGKLDGP